MWPPHALSKMIFQLSGAYILLVPKITILNGSYVKTANNCFVRRIAQAVFLATGGVLIFQPVLPSHPRIIWPDHIIRRFQQSCYPSTIINRNHMSPGFPALTSRAMVGSSSGKIRSVSYDHHAHHGDIKGAKAEAWMESDQKRAYSEWVSFELVGTDRSARKLYECSCCITSPSSAPWGKKSLPKLAAK